MVRSAGGKEMLMQVQSDRLLTIAERGGPAHVTESPGAGAARASGCTALPVPMPNAERSGLTLAKESLI